MDDVDAERIRWIGRMERAEVAVDGGLRLNGGDLGVLGMILKHFRGFVGF
jgi:hypothetical protein